MSVKKKWYRYCFQFSVDWEKSKIERLCPEWWVDLLLFDTVLRHLLKRYKKDIAAWRIHRRADDDQARHIASFMFKVTPAISKTLERAIIRHKVYKWVAVSENFIQFYRKQENLNAEEWPEGFVKAWVPFIQGASEMFLAMLAQAMEAFDQGVEEGHEVDEPEARYSYAHTAIKEVWYRYGGHALFHHLSGLFAYQRLFIRFRELEGVVGCV
jgi:hypothetical protein